MRSTSDRHSWEPVPQLGQRPTNASFLHRGTRALATTHGRSPTRFDYWSGIERLAAQLVVGAVAVLCLWLYTHDHQIAVTRALTLAGVAGMGGAGWVWAGVLRSYRHRRDVLRPLHAGLHRHLGRHEWEAHGRYLHVPPDWASARRPIVVDLPLGFAALDGDQATIEHIVRSTLGSPDLAFDWASRAGATPRLLVRAGLHPPDRVTLDQPAVLDLVEACPEPAPLAGLTAGGTAVRVNLDVDSPHVLVAGGSGCGKSILVEALLAQGLRNGWAASVLDRKLVSQRWCRGIPGVDYWRTIPDMHAGLVALGWELARRCAVVEGWEDDETDPQFARHLVVIEEANATVRKLAGWWAATRERSDPKRSPALEALDELTLMGRMFRMHLVTIAQSGTVAAIGGAENRENYAIRALSRFTVNQWRMLAPEVTPVPRSERHRGRWQLVVGGIATPTQALYLGDAERLHNVARDWATSGVRPVDEGGSPAWQAFVAGELPDAVPASQAIGDGRHLWDTPGHVPGRPALRLVAGQGDELVTLRQAIEGGVVSMSLANLRKARTRDPEFPPPAGRAGPAHRYRRSEVERWSRNRQQTAARGSEAG